MYAFPVNETRLVRGDNVIHVLLKFVGNNFAEDFIDQIPQGNRSKLSNILRMLQFRNNTYVSEVYVSQSNIFLPNLMNEGGYVLTRMILGVLVETR